MSSLSGLGRHIGLRGSLSMALGFVFCVGAGAVAADGGTLVTTQVAGSTRVTPVKSVPAATAIGPLDNNVVGNASLLVPDGSSINVSFGADLVKWYTTEVEPGKSYVIEAFDPYADWGQGSVAGVALYASDGASSPPESWTTCIPTATDTAPGFGLAANYNGQRCIFRTWFPAPGNTQDKRAIFIRVAFFGGVSTSFMIRVRETTIYGRWTTNGYDFHVELQNTSATDMCAYVEAYPNSGTSYTGAAPRVTQVMVPAYGANKIIIPNGTLVGSDNRGTLRINACGAAGQTITTGALHVSTYAFNPVTNQFLYFFPWTANNGNNGNSI